MEYSKEIGQALAETVNELFLADDLGLPLNEIRDPARLRAVINRLVTKKPHQAEWQINKLQALHDRKLKTEAGKLKKEIQHSLKQGHSVKNIEKHLASVHGIKIHEEQEQLDEIRPAERLRGEINKMLVKCGSDPEVKEKMWRLKDLQSKKLANSRKHFEVSPAIVKPGKATKMHMTAMESEITEKEQVLSHCDGVCGNESWSDVSGKKCSMCGGTMQKGPNTKRKEGMKAIRAANKKINESEWQESKKRLAALPHHELLQSHGWKNMDGAVYQRPEVNKHSIVLNHDGHGAWTHWHGTEKATPEGNFTPTHSGSSFEKLKSHLAKL